MNRVDPRRASPVPVTAVPLYCPRRWRRKPWLVAMGSLAMAVLTAPTAARADENPLAPANAAAFNLDILKQRGIDPIVAALFSQKSRFTAGLRRIALSVNGVPRGTVDAQFGANGQLCVTPELLEQGSLKAPAAPLERGPDETSACQNFLAAFPLSEIELRPGREEVSVLVSTEALRPLSEDRGTFQRGGKAGLLNYDLFGLQNQYGGTSSQYTSLNTELGFNAGDWLLRSRQMFSEQDGTRSAQWLYTFAQKTFVRHKAMLQVGEINIAKSVFPGAAITGLQVLPDSALHGKSRGGAIVEGIAQSQARVEIRQAGVLIHTTLVPAGPFRLTDVQVLNGNTDLDVRVIEADGEQRDFTVPAAALAQFSYTAPGYSMALGQVRTFDSPGMQSPLVVTGTGGWLLTPQNTVSAGLLASENQYQAAAFTLDSALTPTTSVNGRGTLSNAGEEGARGAQASVAFSTRLTEKLSSSVNVTRRTEGFRDLLETTHSREAGYTRGLSREQYGLSLSWSDPLLGGFSAGYATSTSFDGGGTQHVTGSWGKSFEHFSVSANVERSLGRNSTSGSYAEPSDRRSSNLNDNALYLSVNVPLGHGRNLRGYSNKRNGQTRFGSSVSDSGNAFGSYQVAADSNTEDRQRNFSGNVSVLPRYTHLNLGYSKSGEESTSYSAQASGGMVLHEDGLTLSPYPLRDTFAVAKVGDMSGVKLSTPSGLVWTDLWGRAVVAQLTPYETSRVEMATTSLPRNVDIKNGSQALSAGRGSVSKMDFQVVTTRRVLLKVRDAHGQPLPKGSGVFNAQGEFLTTVVDGGKLFLSNDQLNGSLSVRLDDDERCRLDYALPDKADPDVYFETAEATCKPL